MAKQSSHRGKRSAFYRRVESALASFRFELGKLEPRTMLCGSHVLAMDGDTPVAYDPPPVIQGPQPVWKPSAELSAEAAASLNAPSGLPLLSSNPDAYAKLYIDFDGNTQINRQPWDLDDSPTTFNVTEQAQIIEMWQRTAEKYAPFNLDITTIDPGPISARHINVVTVSRSTSTGGFAFVNAFATGNGYGVTNATPGYNPKIIADIITHEAGHVVGLEHQSLWENGVKTQEYFIGDSYRAPIMGNLYYAQRALWWYGTSSLGANVYQDDLGVISGQGNAFGYRGDDHGDTFELADPLEIIDSEEVIGDGLIESVDDQDVFSFFAYSGTIDLILNVSDWSPSLDASAELYKFEDDAYTLVASSATSELSESIWYEAQDSGYYRLVVSSAGDYGDVGGYSITAGMPVAPITVPAASSVIAYETSAAQVDLIWIDNAGNETGYRVERSIDDGETWQPVATLSEDATGWSDEDPSPGGDVYYRVVTLAGTNESDPSNIARADMRVGPQATSALAVSFTKIAVSWNAIAGASGYLVEKSSDDGATWQTAGAAAGNATTYQVTGLTPSSEYQFRVRTVLNGYTLAGNVAIAQTDDLQYPDAPQNLVATAGGPYVVNLSWDDVANDDGYILQRSDDLASWVTITNTVANWTTYSDWNFSPDTTWYYRVAGTNEAGQGQWSDVASVTTDHIDPPSVPPTNLHVMGNYGGSFDLEWDDNSGEELDFHIEQMFDGQWEYYDQVGEESYPYYTVWVAPNSTATFRVRGWNPSGVSGPSNELTIHAPPPMPENFHASATSYTAVNLNWDDVDEEVGYRIERTISSQYNWSVIGYPAVDQTSFVDTTAAPNTTYHYRVFALSDEWDSEPNQVYSFTTPNDLPAAPSGVVAAQMNDRYGLRVFWNDVATETGYYVERSLDGVSGWTQFASLGQNVTSVIDANLTLGATYYYRVRGVNAGGFGPYSAVASGVVAPVSPPAAPTNLMQTNASDGAIWIGWMDNANNEIGYSVEWSFGGGSWSVIGTTGLNATSFLRDTVGQGTIVQMRVRAFNDGGSSAYSNVITAQTKPAAPASLTATAITSNRIDLTWNNVTAENGYRVECSLTGTSGWSAVATVAADVTSFSDTTVAANTRYYYRVFSTSPVGNSTSASPIANALTPLLSVPAQPGGVVGTPVSNSQINLSWNDVAEETSYRIERSNDGSTGWASIGTVGVNVTTFSNTGLASGTRYYYRVIAVNAGGDSPPSSTVSPYTFTNAPATASATPISANQVNLSWSDVAGESGYHIERSTNGGANWVLVGNVAAGALVFSDTSAVGGTNHQYRVKAYNASGDSAASPVASALTVPLAPIATASTVSDTQITVTWTNVSGESGYTLERSANGGSTWTFTTTLAADVTSFNDSGLLSGTTFTYRVRASNASGSSANSANVGATTKPAAPTNLAAPAASTSQINLSWTDVAGDTGYVVERSSNGTSGWTQVGTTAANVTTFQNTGLAAGTTYYYRVLASGAGGNSAYSNTAMATTQQAIPATPGNLVATAVNKTTIQLTWSDNSANEQGFRIERSLTGTGSWTQIATVGANVTSYTNTGLTRNTRYYYRIVAYNTAGTSPYSNIANAITPKN